MTMKSRNPVTRPVSPMFAKRWSPYVFDAEREVRREDLESIF